MDIDQRNSILSNYLKGRSTTPGRVDKIVTLSQFDKEVRAAYVQKFDLKRKYGLLDASSVMDKWLGFKNYAPTKRGSKFATVMGHRDWEVLCYKFFLDNKGIPCLRYRANELSDVWLPTKDKPPIHALSPEAPSTIQELLQIEFDIKEPREWPEWETVKRNIIRDNDMTSEQHAEWISFFDSVPKSKYDFETENCFTWTLPQLYANKQKWQVELHQLPDDSTDINDVIPHEILVHPGHTQTELNKEKKEMMAKKKAIDAADAEKAEAKKLRLQRTTSLHDKGSVEVPKSDNNEDRHDYSPETMVCGDSVVRVDDYIVISPDADSRAKDKIAGYNLGLNIGRVTSLNLTKNELQIWWYFAKTWDGEWIPWKCPKKKVPYKEWVSTDSLLEDENNIVIRPEMVPCRRKREKVKLTRESLKLLEQLAN
jgi:hypothetical protein